MMSTARTHTRLVRIFVWMLIATFFFQSLAPAGAAAAKGFNLGQQTGKTWLPSDMPYSSGSTDFANMDTSERVGGCFYPTLAMLVDKNGKSYDRPGTREDLEYPFAAEPLTTIDKQEMREFTYRVGMVTTLYVNGTTYSDENDSGYKTTIAGVDPTDLKALGVAPTPENKADDVKGGDDGGEEGEISAADFQGQFKWFKAMIEHLNAEDALGGFLVVPDNDADGMAANVAIRNIPASCMPPISTDPIKAADLKAFITHPFEFLKTLFLNSWTACASFLYNLVSPIVWKIGFFTPHVERGETLIQVMQWDATCFVSVGLAEDSCKNKSLGFDPENIDDAKIEEVGWIKASKVVRLLVTTTYFLIIAWAALVHVARPQRKGSWNLYTKLPQVILATVLVLAMPPLLGMGVTLSNQMTKAAFEGAFGTCGSSDGLAACSVQDQTNRVVSNSGSLLQIEGGSGERTVASQSASWLGGFFSGPMVLRLIAMTFVAWALASVALYAVIRQILLILLIITLPLAATALIDEKWKHNFQLWLKILLACLAAPPLMAIIGAVMFSVNPLNNPDVTNTSIGGRVLGLVLFVVTIYAMAAVSGALRKWAFGGGRQSLASRMWSSATGGNAARAARAKAVGQNGIGGKMFGGARTPISAGSSSAERAMSQATSSSHMESSASVVKETMQGLAGKSTVGKLALGAGAIATGGAAGYGLAQLGSGAAGAAGAAGAGGVGTAGAGADAAGSQIFGRLQGNLNGDTASAGAINGPNLGTAELRGRGAQPTSQTSPAYYKLQGGMGGAGGAGGQGSGIGGAGVGGIGIGGMGGTGGAGLVKTISGRPMATIKHLDERLQSTTVNTAKTINRTFNDMTSRLKLGEVGLGSATQGAARAMEPKPLDGAGKVTSGGWHGQSPKGERVISGAATSGNFMADLGQQLSNHMKSETSNIDGFKQMTQAAQNIAQAMGEVVSQPGYGGSVDKQQLYDALQEALKHHPGAAGSGRVSSYDPAVGASSE